MKRTLSPRQKLIAIVTLIAITIFFALYSFNSKYKTNSTDLLSNRKTFVETMNSNKAKLNLLFKNLSESSLLKDTGFVAEYRTRPNKYNLYFLKNNQREMPLHLSDSTESYIFSVAKEMNVDYLWKYNSEPFYRLVFVIDDKFRPQVLMPQQGEMNAAFHGTAFDSVAVVVNENQITTQKMLYKITDSIFVYFP